MRLAAATSVMVPPCLAWARLERREEVVQRFGQRGVRKHRVAEPFVRYPSHHRELQGRHQLAALDAQHRGAEYLSGNGVHQGLHEAARLVELQGTRHLVHRQPGDPHRPALFLCLPLRQPDSAQLGIDEYRVGYEPVCDTCTAAL
jgi:hypothetical protein